AVIEVGLIPPLVSLLQNADFDLKREAAWATTNATAGVTLVQIKYLGDQGCIKPLGDLLVFPDQKNCRGLFRGPKEHFDRWKRRE
ncbi:hypothetical protein RYX36_009430, partial [Vicia faba]